jgi:hypothetical protein
MMRKSRIIIGVGGVKISGSMAGFTTPQPLQTIN